jgi:hypothetical protein
VGVAQGVKTGSFRKLQPPEEQRDGGRNRVRSEWRSIWVGEDQIEVRFVVRTELAAKYSLLLTMRFQLEERRRRNLDDAGFLGFCSFELKAVLCLRQGPRDGESAVFQVRPSEG